MFFAAEMCVELKQPREMTLADVAVEGPTRWFFRFVLIVSN